MSIQPRKWSRRTGPVYDDFSSAIKNIKFDDLYKNGEEAQKAWGVYIAATSIINKSKAVSKFETGSPVFIANQGSSRESNRLIKVIQDAVAYDGGILVSSPSEAIFFIDLNNFKFDGPKFDAGQWVSKISFSINMTKLGGVDMGSKKVEGEGTHYNRKEESSALALMQAESSLRVKMKELGL